MFGCLRRLGCLIVLLVAAAAGYSWYVHRRVLGTTSALAATWSRVTAADAVRGKQAVMQLQASSGRVFANLTPAEAVAYLIQTAAKTLPPSAEDVQAMIVGDTLRVRAVVPLRDLGVEQALGPLASLVGGRDTVQLSGTVDVIHPGLAQFRVTDVTIQQLTVPSPILPKLVARLRRTAPDGVAPTGLPFPLPPYIADLRIGNGKVTLYKNV